MKICGRLAQSGVVAVKDFHNNIQEIDSTINQKWQKMPKKTRKYDIFAIISKNKQFRPIVPLKVKYKLSQELLCTNI